MTDYLFLLVLFLAGALGAFAGNWLGYKVATWLDKRSEHHD
jgi:hypothetical protein